MWCCGRKSLSAPMRRGEISLQRCRSIATAGPFRGGVVAAARTVLRVNGPARAAMPVRCSAAPPGHDAGFARAQGRLLANWMPSRTSRLRARIGIVVDPLCRLSSSRPHHRGRWHAMHGRRCPAPTAERRAVRWDIVAHNLNLAVLTPATGDVSAPVWTQPRRLPSSGCRCPTKCRSFRRRDCRLWHAAAASRRRRYRNLIPLEILHQKLRAQRTFSLVLGSVAGLALLIGGIGIMNTMLASVLERTSEIGLRRTVGATRRHIWLQFLLESTCMAGAGGVLGILLGIAGSFAITRYAGWPTDLSLGAIMLASATSCATGIFFGTYPARRAASLEPVDAVRFE